MARLYSLSLLILTAIVIPVLATDSRDLCFWENGTTYKTPFTPWFKGWPNVTSGPGDDVDNLACWWYADCIYSISAATSQQQYASIGIVMGLIPLVLKDIAWPQRRIVLSLSRGHWVYEIIIRALGLTPKITRNAIIEGRTFSRAVSRVVLVLLVAFLVMSYGLLAVMEVYSKRSSLGCPVPAFVVLWFIVALLPAGIEVAFSRFKPRTEFKEVSTEELSTGLANGGCAEPGDSHAGKDKETCDCAAGEYVQGGDSHWIVQFCWALYYGGGSLIFSSIMLVTVSELFIWMLIAGLVTAANKLLAYKLCGYWGTGLK